ncbi:MAG: PilZ domain-containing protein [Alkalispirochaetaceae bacterium]
MSGVNTPVTDIDSRRPAGGRRVYFLYPPSVVEDSMIQFLITAQYEAAIIKDHRAVVPVIRKNPNSIIYCNLDAKGNAQEIERLIRHLVETKEEHGCDVGVLSYNKDPSLVEKYLMDIGVTAGYVTLKIGFEESAKIIIRTLEAAEARGRRQFVRVKVPQGKGSLSVQLERKKIEGELLDVSVAGIACRLPEEFPAGTYLEDIQLRLWGTLVGLSGKIAGSRQAGGRPIYVVLFEEPVSSLVRGRIYGFVRKVLQAETDVHLPRR